MLGPCAPNATFCLLAVLTLRPFVSRRLNSHAVHEVGMGLLRRHLLESGSVSSRREAAISVMATRPISRRTCVRGLLVNVNMVFARDSNYEIERLRSVSHQGSMRVTYPFLLFTEMFIKRRNMPAPEVTHAHDRLVVSYVDYRELRDTI